MVTPRDLIFGVLLPFFTALCLWAWSARGRAEDAAADEPRDKETPTGGSMAAPSLLLGYVIAHDALFGAPGLQFTSGVQWTSDVVQWVYYAALALLATTALSRALRLPGWAAGILSAAVLAGTAVLVLRPQAAQIGWSWGAGWVLAWLVSAESLRWKLRFDGGIAATLALVGVGFLNALVLTTSGSQSYGQLAAIAPAALAAGLLVTLRGKRAAASEESAAVFVLLTGGLLACGRLYAEVKLLDAVLLAAAPLGLWVAHFPGIRSLAAWKRGLVTVVVTVAPAAVAATLSILRFREAMADPYASMR